MTIQDPILQNALEKLTKHVPRAVLVGGSVRDLFLGHAPKDADVEVYGIEAEKLLDIVTTLFGSVDVVGEMFGVIKVFLAEGRELDIALPRKEAKSGTGHKGFLIESDPFLSFPLAAKRRDFTINAMGLDLKTGEILDPYNGKRDLAARVLRVVDEKTFVDDPLRVFRAVQFAARFSFMIEEKSFALMKEMVQKGEMEELSRERITEEWKKFLVKSRTPSIALHLLRELGIVERYYPELFALIGTKQEPEWHPEGDVWTHTLMVIDEAAQILHDPAKIFSREEQLVVMLSALCHDFGKPLTTTVLDGKIRSLGHEEAGGAPAQAFCERLSFAHQVSASVVAITKDHLKPAVYYRQFEKGELNEEQYANALRRLLKRLRGVSPEVFLTVTESDIRGRGRTPYRGTYVAGNVFRRIVHQYALEDAAKTFLLTGQEIMDYFGVKQGKKIGEIMEAVEKARDDGRIRTKEEARAFVYNQFHLY